MTCGTWVESADCLRICFRRICPSGSVVIGNRLPLRSRKLGEIELLDEAQQILYRHEFPRSGEIRLDFVLTSDFTPSSELSLRSDLAPTTVGAQSPPQFDEFIRSIRITHSPTRFND
jgi:hypothetical protein